MRRAFYIHSLLTMSKDSSALMRGRCGSEHTLVHNDPKGFNVVATEGSGAETNLLSVDQAVKASLVTFRADFSQHLRDSKKHKNTSPVVALYRSLTDHLLLPLIGKDFTLQTLQELHGKLVSALIALINFALFGGTICIRIQIVELLQMLYDSESW